MFFLIFFTFCAIGPFINMAAQSMSGNSSVMAGRVGLWPVDFTLMPYKELFKDRLFFNGMFISIMRTVIGSLFSILMCVLLAYPMSKKHLRGIPFITVVVMLTMFFSPGMIPSFIVIKNVKLMNNFLVYIIPGAVSAYNTLLLRNFFQSIPAELEEAAYIDGAANMHILFSIYAPLSMPIIATVGLFVAVGQWNSFFDAILYVNDRMLYPVQVYLREVIARYANMVNLQELLELPVEASMIAAVTIASMIPIIIVYPFLQKYFVKGVIIGAVKG
jgi:putative aldouronate transport system permease protein